jgi:hypothetical protein
VSVKRDLERVKSGLICPHCGRRYGAPQANGDRDELARLSYLPYDEHIAEVASRTIRILDYAAALQKKRVVMIPADMHDALMREVQKWEESRHEPGN